MEKILAVIPARAGSKGIPNKNIRLVNGKPLIYYTIKNAIDSERITDIIVTTDSPEIEVIAKQMGVQVWRRSEELCGDDVALDEVVYDASREIVCEYVVTLQPTSPTLKPETIDKALEYAAVHALDTLISVINRPHLAWKEVKGVAVPAYVERLNRQYLPPFYVETGAFLISRKKVVTEKNRIGATVDIYPLSEEEAVDIDTFIDLKYVEMLLSKPKVAIYVNGNNTRGIGHIYRALELADEFFVKPDIYYDINQTKREVFGETTHKLKGVNGIGELLNIFAEEKYSILINDILTTTIDYMLAVKQAMPDAKIVNFEDDGEGIYKADLVINALYQQSDLSYIKTGENYYISSKLFMFYKPIKIKEKVKKVFISFGGADPQNYSDRLLQIIKGDKYRHLEFVVVLGRAKLNVEQLMKYNEYANLEVLYDVKNMAEIMSECDIAVTSRGRTGYELAILGIPTIAMAQNAREEKHGFVNNENGFFYLGLNPGDHIIESTLDMLACASQNDRHTYQIRLLQHDLRNGRKRVMNLVNDLI